MMNDAFLKDNDFLAKSAARLHNGIMVNTSSRLRDALALTFASFFPLVMAVFYFVILDHPEGELNPAIRLAFGVGKAIQFLFPIGYVWWFERERIGFAPPTWRGMALGIGFALVVALGMFGLYFAWVKDIPAVSTDTPVRIHEKVKQFGADSLLGFLQLALAISFVHSLAEEYYWRWFVFGWMRRHMPMALAIVLSSIGFMLHHVVILGVYFPGHFWMLALPFSICVAVGGGFWAWLYARSGSLYAPWISHCLIDSAIMVVGYVMLEARLGG
jgi:membrane protease YdiL (CAAX protease family)